MKDSLRRKAAIITGAASGLGLAFAEALIEQGAQVALADLNETAGKAAAQKLSVAGANCFFHRTDVANSRDAQALIAATMEKFGRLDILINNAGVQHLAPIHELEEEQWNRLLGVILTGTFLCTKYALPPMMAQKRGRIINISSIHGLIDRLQHTSTVYPNEQIVALAEKLAQITPGRLQKSYFTNSGTEANEVALLVSRMATGSFDVVSLRHAYSGHSQLTKAVTAMAPWRKSGVISVGVSHAISPYCYRCPWGQTYPSCGVACANDVEEVIRTTTSGNIAAFIAEPIQGAGGFITPPKEYFKMVFTIVKKYGGLFIADEVQTGFARTGKKWFGIEHWEVEPDIITTAKGMANGVPVGATIATPEVADGYKGMTISTFGGNPVTAVAARATIEVIEEEKLLDNAERMGNHFRAQLEELQQKYPLIGDVRGMGLMQGLELVKDRKTKEPAPEATNQFMERCRTNGLLIGKGGLYGNVIRLSPPLNIGQGDVDEAIRLMDKSLAEVK